MWIAAFLFGLISSLHCIGMCGPIALMLPVDRTNDGKRIFQILLYHFGRITSYATLGIIFGFFGKGLQLAGIQQNLSIFSGVMMILIVIIPEKKFSQINFSKPIARFIFKLKQRIGNQFKRKSNSSIFSIGVLNGFLPCGLVYAALFGAIATQNIFGGGFYMILYGLGTIPLMSVAVLLSHFFQNKMRNQIQKIIPIAGIFLGTLFILRGLGLQIDYISPGNISLFIKSMPDCF